MAELTDKQELFAHPDDVYVGECVIYTGYRASSGYVILYLYNNRVWCGYSPSWQYDHPDGCRYNGQ